MKKVALLLSIFALVALLGCVQERNYPDPVSPLYAFENFESAVSYNDYEYAWTMLSSDLKEKRFENSIDSFKTWVDQGGPELKALLEGSYISEIIVEQNAVMLLNKTNGGIRFVKNGSYWAMDSLLLPPE